MEIDHKFKAKLEKELGPITFAMFMRVTRNSLGLTQEAYGRKVGMSRANVCDIEKGRQLVSAELALKVARKAGFPEKFALQVCLQDQVRRAGIDAKIAIS